MVADLSAETLLSFAIADFEVTWNAVTRVPDPVARANFMFGKQATVLLELAARACTSDQTGSALLDFSAALDACEPRYFESLPGIVWAPSMSTRRAFTLPSRPGVDPYGHVLAAIFNLVRNGQAHQYQQMRAVLSDSTHFCVQLTGAQPGLHLPSGTIDRREHLSHGNDGGDIWLKVRPDVLFVDLRDAIRTAQLEHRGLSLAYLVEDRSATFAFDHTALKAVLDGMKQ